ncbi:MAG: plasmid mobilization relaxosome protein MobC [Lachnospiraceae bacterium]|nr:plasmid mobilization relaxosome protein MobC [Lachnospiraceae bacterium]
MNTKKADIHFRVLPEEKKVIEKAAEAAGKQLSEYAREVILAASDYTVTEITDVRKESLQRTDSSRNRDIHIRLSEEELKYYADKAEEAGCSVSEYIRRSASGNEIRIIPDMKEMAKQVAKLGVNVNQLTILAHQGKIKEVDLFSANDTLKQILQQLVKLNKKG